MRFLREKGNEMNDRLKERIHEFNRRAEMAESDGYTVAEGYVWEGWGNPTGPCARKVCKVEDYEQNPIDNTQRKGDTTMKYSEFKDMLQKKADDLPIIFAFSNEQLDKALDDMGLSLQDMNGDKLIRMGMGAFCLKSELEHIHGELDKIDEMKHDFIKDYEQAYDAFFYEMGNHEYHINWQGDWDVLSCFGLDDDVCEYEDGKDVDEYMDAMGLSPVTKAAYHDARGDFLRMCDENDWY